MKKVENQFYRLFWSLVNHFNFDYLMIYSIPFVSFRSSYAWVIWASAYMCSIWERKRRSVHITFILKWQKDVIDFRLFIKFELILVQSFKSKKIPCQPFLIVLYLECWFPLLHSFFIGSMMIQISSRSSAMILPVNFSLLSPKAFSTCLHYTT